MTDEQIEIDVADLDAMFSRIPSGPYSADARGESWEVRAIDTDPTNDHHWPYRLCESIRGQKAGCDPDVFGFIAGVINAWPSIRAALSARHADAVQPAAGEGGLREALEPLAKLSSDAEWDDVPDNARADVVYRSEAGGEESVGTIAFADFRRARAALSTSVPAGVVVPREPTDAMLRVGVQATVEGAFKWEDRDVAATWQVCEAYRAMVASCITPPAQEPTR